MLIVLYLAATAKTLDTHGLQEHIVITVYFHTKDSAQKCFGNTSASLKYNFHPDDSDETKTLCRARLACSIHKERPHGSEDIAKVHVVVVRSYLKTCVFVRQMKTVVSKSCIFQQFQLKNASQN